MIAMLRVGIVVACLALAGCEDGVPSAPDAIIHRPEYNPPTPVTVRWEITNNAGEQQPCPDGFDIAEVVVAGYSGRTMPYPCADRIAMFTLISREREQHGLLIRISRSLGGEVFIASGSPGIYLPPTGTPIEITFSWVTDLGHLHVAWLLQQAGGTTTCAEAGLSLVHLDVTPASGPTVSRTYPCSDEAAWIKDLPSGPAHVVVIAGASTVAIDTVVPTWQRLASIDAILSF